jgi:thiol-disulfide isomerase/thioredoxin
VYLLDEWRLLTGQPVEARRQFREFQLELMHGGTISSADVRGKVTLINFWASWCGPCRREMPELSAFEHSIPDSSFQLVTFNEDVSSTAASRFLTEMNLRFEYVAMGGGRLKSKYGYIGLPYTVLLDRNGRVVFSWTGFGGTGQMRQLETLVRRELEMGGQGIN